MARASVINACDLAIAVAARSVNPGRAVGTRRASQLKQWVGPSQMPEGPGVRYATVKGPWKA